MCQNILISLEGRHASNILSGNKTVEVRRRPVRVQPGTRIWVYTKKPVGAIAMAAIVKTVIEGDSNELWDICGKKMGISREELDDYLGSRTGCAIALDSVEALHCEVSLEEIRKHRQGFMPPQFFSRLHAESPELGLLRQRSGFADEA